jgi:hypothetical protein
VTPERAAALVARWVRRYTRGLPEPIARRRIEEIDADVADHVAHGRAHGTAEGRIALGVLSRAVRGVAADASWRAGHRPAATRPATPEEHMRPPTPIRRSVARVALATGLVLMVPLIATLVSEGATWSVFDFALAAVLLAGIGATLELAARRAGRIPPWPSGSRPSAPSRWSSARPTTPPGSSSWASCSSSPRSPWP